MQAQQCRVDPTLRWPRTRLQSRARCAHQAALYTNSEKETKHFCAAHQDPFVSEDADGKSRAEVIAEKKLWLSEPDRDYTYTEVRVHYTVNGSGTNDMIFCSSSVDSTPSTSLRTLPSQEMAARNVTRFHLPTFSEKDQREPYSSMLRTFARECVEPQSMSFSSCSLNWVLRALWMVVRDWSSKVVSNRSRLRMF